jgi:phospholipase A1/A2
VNTVFSLDKKEFYLQLGILALGLILIIDTAAHAAEISIAMAKDRWPGDQRIEFSLSTSGGGEAESPDLVLPDHVVCTLESGRRTHTVIARRIEAAEGAETMAIAGRNQALYAFDPPTNARGTVRLRIAEVRVPVILFDIDPPQSGSSMEDSYPTLDSLFTLYQPYIGNIGAYKPMYFLFGTDLSKSKFQISFNYSFFNPESDVAERYPWVKGFHFGYTQTSFWDLGSSSAPFEDNGYKPELFWVSKNFVPAGSLVKGLFLQSGFQHESNGQGGDDSRSTNFLYLQPLFIFFSDANHYGLQVAPKLWAYVNNDNDTNPDLDKYRGYFDLELKIGKMDSLVLGSSFRWAAEGASIQLDLTYPLGRFLFNTLDIYLHAQYVNALAESLIDYKDRSHAFRLGFSVVR